MVLLETSETEVPLVSNAGLEDRTHNFWEAGTLKKYLAVQPVFMLNAVIL